MRQHPLLRQALVGMQRQETDTGDWVRQPPLLRQALVGMHNRLGSLAGCSTGERGHMLPSG